MAKVKLHPRNANALGLLLVLIMSTAVALFITNQVLIYQYFPFDYDEANHVNGALALYLELQDLDLKGFATEFMSQGFYPPGFTWLKAIAFLFFGASSTVARLFSVISFFLAMLAIYAVPAEIDHDFGWLAGITAVALTLTIQPLLVNSAMVMMEAPGLLATFTMLWLYLRAIKRPTRSRLLGVSLLLLLTFLTKYTYGVIAVGAICAMELSWFIIDKHPDPHTQTDGSGSVQCSGGKPFLSRLPYSITQRWLWLFGPFLVALLLWFVGGNNTHSFLAYATAQPPDQPWITRENLFYYPQVIAEQFVPSPLFAAFSLAGLSWAIWNWRNPLIRVLVLYFAVGALVMTVNLPKNPRFIATVVPALHILCGLLLSQAVASLFAEDRSTRLVARAFTILLVLTALISIPTVVERYAAYPSLMEVEYETSPHSDDILKWIDENIPADSRFFVLNYWDQVSPQRIAWYWGTEANRPVDEASFEDLLMPSALVQEATIENIIDLQQKILQSGADYVVLFEGGAWGLPFWPEYMQAMQETLVPEARESFQVSYFDTDGWQDTELLRKAAWETVKERGQYTLDIDVIIFRVNQPD